MFIEPHGLRDNLDDIWMIDLDDFFENCIDEFFEDFCKDDLDKYGLITEITISFLLYIYFSF